MEEELEYQEEVVSEEMTKEWKRNPSTERRFKKGNFLRAQEHIL